MSTSDRVSGELAPVLAVRRVQELLNRRLYAAADLMRLTGMTRKQVTYWARIGLVQPTLKNPHATTGQPALFYAGMEVVKALVVCELRHAGFSLRQIRQVARNLEVTGGSLYNSEAYLLTDGYSVYYAFSDREVVDMMKHHRQQLLLLPLHEQLAKLREVA